MHVWPHMRKPTEKACGYSVGFACWGKIPNPHLSMINHVATHSKNDEYGMDTEEKVIVSSPFLHHSSAVMVGIR